MMKHAISIYGTTDVGRVRQTNEDAFLVSSFNEQGSRLEVIDETKADLEPTTHCALVAVADGLGGHAGGKIASTTVVETLRSYLQAKICECEDSARIRDELVNAIEVCHSNVIHYGTTHPGLEEMASTVTAGWIVEDHLYLVHVGDSRFYLLRDGQLLQLTDDHTLANHPALRQLGVSKLSTENRFSNVLWNTIGGLNSRPNPDLAVCKLQANDKFLFCTDGLSNYLSTDSLTQILKQDNPVSQICSQLIERANAMGGRDNITTVVAEVHQSSRVKPQAAAVAATEPTASALADTVDYVDSQPRTSIEPTPASKLENKIA